VFTDKQKHHTLLKTDSATQHHVHVGCKSAYYMQKLVLQVVIFDYT